jgi:hypothetical protein
MSWNLLRRGSSCRIIFCISFFCLLGQLAKSQWSTPDGSGNIYNTNTGNVGIGTNSPQAKLHVAGSIYSSITNSVAFSTESTLGVVIQQGNIGNDFVSGNSYLSVFAHNIQFNGTNWIRRNQYSNTWAMVLNSQYYDIQYAIANGSQPANTIVTPATYLRITPTGNVLIGKTSQTNSSYLLDVNGSGRMNQLVINTTGADFVFDTAYHMPALSEVEAFIKKNHHLQGLSSASGMQRDGMDVGENETKLLQKIEELTLYIIEQDKKLRALEYLEQRISSLERSAGQSK